jgi:dolichol-phosphate mannosyltransferase
MQEPLPTTPSSSSPTAALPPVSVIVPTYREAGNLPELISQLEQVQAGTGLSLEVLIVDDDSADGTERIVRDLGKSWVRLITRKGVRGLSTAVLEGLRQASHDIAVVMDADLSHPPEAIPQLVQAILAGADFAIGSRYVAGGSTDAAWSLFRRLNSSAATLLARPLTSVKDPMSGFFAIHRQTLSRADHLNPVGYKIGLELLVRCDCKDVREVPIHFAERTAGQSKLSLAQQLRYLQHLRRLMSWKYPQLGWITAAMVVILAALIVSLCM